VRNSFPSVFPFDFYPCSRVASSDRSSRSSKSFELCLVETERLTSVSPCEILQRISPPLVNSRILSLSSRLLHSPANNLSRSKPATRASLLLPSLIKLHASTPLSNPSLPFLPTPDSTAPLHKLSRTWTRWQQSLDYVLSKRSTAH